MLSKDTFIAHLSGHNLALEKPTKCPRCESLISVSEPASHAAEIYITKSLLPQKIQYAFNCMSCKKLFIANYISEYRNSLYAIEFLEPFSPTVPNIHPDIEKLSPMFCEIYQQAIVADQIGLEQIAGMGLRKALEFLIKDYCQQITNQELHSKIQEMPLSQCITKYIDSAELKIVAERAAWIGNDETHYRRIWKNKDIDDLKTLLSNIQPIIVQTVEAKKLLKEMPNK